MNIDFLINLSIGGGFMLGLVGFAGTMLFADNFSKAKKQFALFATILLVGVIMLVGTSTMFIDMRNKLPTQTETNVTFQDIYSATVPYGIISSYGSGWRYYYSQNYAEIYSIKVMRGNEVLTYSYKTDSCRVVVDGTFKLELTEARFYKIDPYDGSRIYCWSDGRVPTGMTDRWQSWKPIIHIPEMPTPQNTITDWYVGG